MLFRGGRHDNTAAIGGLILPNLLTKTEQFELWGAMLNVGAVPAIYQPVA
jgi:hypothetical protein